MYEIVELLNHVVARQAVTSRPGAVPTKGGFGSAPPLDLDALELRDEFLAAFGSEYVELEAAVMSRIERPARVPLGLCTCGTPVSCEFDRVAAECPACGDWLSRAEAVHAAREWLESTWLTPAEIEQETRSWGTPVRSGRVRTWRWRGWIAPDGAGRYCLADVLRLIDRQAAEAA
ncbi:hypothetical protein [Amycolatopsis sp. Hca4]|uniref:hypothetical protein n=1 Tax=Amycolatopsis sp. Hca4 TaxID=2742131 RepID=UPI001591247D|nr:hypothetical protein [Amycolatopsis sp. Hca4]QKV74552.1 hypothetical protein HUT10_12800 [Amycolatopsis sp. Hca4]